MPKPSWKDRLLRREEPHLAPDNATPEESVSKPRNPCSINAVYYPNWRVYRNQPPSSLNLKYITHIYYAFATIDQEGTVGLTDEYADTQIDIHGAKGCLGDLKRVKAQHPHMKTLLSIGGEKCSENFATVASNARKIRQFAETAVAKVREYELDGIDIDWEHPTTPSQGHDYTTLLSTLRSLFPPPLLLTSALPAGQWALQHIDLVKASRILDYVNLMTYDFSGPWTKQCGHHSQLRSPEHPHSDAARLSCCSAVAYVRGQGVPAGKIVLGVPAYGRSFVGAEKIGDGHAGEKGGVFEYRALPVCGAREGFDEGAGAAYCVGAECGFVSYDDLRSVEAKAMFVKEQGLAGLFYWNGTGDRNDERSLVAWGWKTLLALGGSLKEVSDEDGDNVVRPGMP